MTRVSVDITSHQTRFAVCHQLCFICLKQSLCYIANLVQSLLASTQQQRAEPNGRTNRSVSFNTANPTRPCRFDTYSKHWVTFKACSTHLCCWCSRASLHVTKAQQNSAPETTQSLRLGWQACSLTGYCEHKQPQTEVTCAQQIIATVCN